MSHPMNHVKRVYLRCNPLITNKRVRVSFWPDKLYQDEMNKSLRLYFGLGPALCNYNHKKFVADIHINVEQASRQMLEHEIIHATFAYFRHMGVFGISMLPFNAYDPHSAIHRM